MEKKNDRQFKVVFDAIRQLMSPRWDWRSRQERGVHAASPHT